MFLKMFVIQDVKADAYRSPFFFSTNGEALRAFSELVNDGQSMISKYPEDFKLWVVATYDDSNGVIRPMEHVALGFGSEYKREVKGP